MQTNQPIAATGEIDQLKQRLEEKANSVGIDLNIDVYKSQLGIESMDIDSLLLQLWLKNNGAVVTSSNSNDYITVEPKEETEKHTTKQIKRNPIKENTQNSIRNQLARYKHAKQPEFDGHILKVTTTPDTNNYDKDALIGLITRKYDLDYTGEHNGRLHFGNWKPI